MKEEIHNISPDIIKFSISVGHSVENLKKKLWTLCMGNDILFCTSIDYLTGHHISQFRTLMPMVSSLSCYIFISCKVFGKNALQWVKWIDSIMWSQLIKNEIWWPLHNKSIRLRPNLWDILTFLEHILPFQLLKFIEENFTKKKKKFIEEIHFKKVMLLKDWSDISFLLSMF